MALAQCRRLRRRSARSRSTVGRVIWVLGKPHVAADSAKQGALELEARGWGGLTVPRGSTGFGFLMGPFAMAVGRARCRLEDRIEGAKSARGSADAMCEAGL